MKVVIASNPYRDRGFELAAKARELLERDGHETAVSPVFAEAPDGSGLTELPRALERAELIVAIGGDGTFLNIARRSLGRDIPILGVNMGTKGFMATLEPEQIELVRNAARGQFRRSARMLLDVELTRADGTAERDCALNDAVIKSDVNCIGLTVFSDAERISRFSGDGVIISTPTGSTAYSMSAGGPIVEPEAEALIVTPICAHALAAKSFVLRPRRTVRAVPERLTGRKTVLSVDGSEGIELHGGDVVTVKKSDRSVIMADMMTKSFYETAQDKLTHS